MSLKNKANERIDPPTLEEVKQTLTIQKNKKASGILKIHSELYK